jgi:C-terminal processing protease CtpA/Prc
MGGPAQKGGLKKDDILISINSNDPTYENLYKTFARSKPGDLIQLSIQREGNVFDLIFTAERAN